MGTGIEVNDTLQLTEEQGFPIVLLNREKHVKQAIKASKFEGKIFEFHKDDARIFHLDPVRVYLVQNISGKWLFWGRALIQSQQISKALNPDGSWTEGHWNTSGTYKIMDIYDPDYQVAFTTNESPKGKAFTFSR